MRKGGKLRESCTVFPGLNPTRTGALCTFTVAFVNHFKRTRMNNLLPDTRDSCGSCTLLLDIIPNSQIYVKSLTVSESFSKSFGGNIVLCSFSGHNVARIQHSHPWWSFSYVPTLRRKRSFYKESNICSVAGSQ